MNATLKLTDQLMSTALHYQSMGCPSQAIDTFKQLSKLRKLPRRIAQDARFHMAELYLQLGEPQKARRKLHALIEMQPDSARYHHLMGQAYDEDDDGDVGEALFHYHRAVELDGDDPEHHCNYGLCLLEVGEEDEAVICLEKAVELAPDEIKYVEILGLTLIDLSRPADARRIVLAHWFGHARDPEWKQLWDEIRYRETLSAQGRYTYTESYNEDEPVLLPFECSGDTQGEYHDEVEAAILRMDDASVPAHPKGLAGTEQKQKQL